MSDPWAGSSPDGEPAYTGPPPTTPPPAYGPPAYGPPGYGPPGYWPAPYAPAPYAPMPYGPGPYGVPRPPARPGTVVGAAVMTFVQAAVVLVASLYVWFSAAVLQSAVDEDPTGAPTAAYELSDLGTTLAVVQLVSVVLLVVGGVLALTRRTRVSWLVLVGALAVQVVIAVYWAVRLDSILGQVVEVESVLAVISLFFATLPLVSLGLLLIGSGRRWFTGPQV
ncbi:hypothetical protein [Blastococcus sp. TF02-8]|uniref:hypothetical protein n=1 Tax=Blastococcus sp. TF02-8 TaxID=2250574 RepID=UPI0011BFDAE5|nr:hypothetical protein [Blastococcus sp. TF02-8]